MVHTSIELALMARLDALVLSPALPIAWPNRPFTPPSQQNWLRATFLPGDSFAFSLDNDGDNQNPGLMQVDVFSSGLKEGEPTLLRIADQIITQFKRGTALYSDGFKIQITAPPSRLPLQSDAGGSFIPVRVRWNCFAANPA